MQSRSNLYAGRERVRELDSHEVPEFLVIAIESGSRSYLEWLAASLL